jgi:hypothetical protein
VLLFIERDLDRNRQWVRLMDEEEEDKEIKDDDISGIDGEK